MSYLLTLTTSQCFSNAWIPVYGVYWAVSSTSTTNAKILMSRTGGYCPGGEGKYIKIGESAVFGDNEFTVKLEDAYRGQATIRIFETLEEPEDTGFGFGRAEITQTNIGPGTVFNVNSSIDYTLRVMNTGDSGKIYGVIGLGYHDKDGRVYFTGRYANEQAQVLSGETITWNAHIDVLHKDYAAREMTPRGPAVYFMSGHDENGSIIWDRSEYIPVELILESGYVDPTDPEGVPDDWDEPIYDPSRPWDFISDIIPEISKFVDNLIPEKEEEEKEKPVDIMPFIYIGFMGLIGYLLIKVK